MSADNAFNENSTPENNEPVKCLEPEQISFYMNLLPEAYQDGSLVAAIKLNTETEESLSRWFSHATEIRVPDEGTQASLLIAIDNRGIYLVKSFGEGKEERPQITLRDMVNDDFAVYMMVRLQGRRYATSDPMVAGLHEKAAAHVISLFKQHGVTFGETMLMGEGDTNHVSLKIGKIISDAFAMNVFENPLYRDIFLRGKRPHFPRQVPA